VRAEILELPDCPSCQELVPQLEKALKERNIAFRKINCGASLECAATGERVDVPTLYVYNANQANPKIYVGKAGALKFLGGEQKQGVQEKQDESGNMFIIAMVVVLVFLVIALGVAWYLKFAKR
jgi:thiol-disulfide isomerase/thioredoxin